MAETTIRQFLTDPLLSTRATSTPETRREGQRGEIQIRAADTDNRPLMANLCRFFKQELAHERSQRKGSVSARYTAESADALAPLDALEHQRTLAFLKAGFPRMTSLIATEQHEIIAHLGIRRRAAGGESKSNVYSIELVLPFGDLSALLPFLKESRTIRNASELFYFGPARDLTAPDFAAIGLTPTATIGALQYTVAYRGTRLNSSGQMYSSSKAMAIFVPSILAVSVNETFEKLKINRKVKSPERGATNKGPWAYNADRRAVKILHRIAGVYSIQPSLLDRHRRDELIKSRSTKEFLIDMFDPAAEELAELLLGHGFSYAGIVPQWNGSDYLVMSRAIVTQKKSQDVSSGDRMTSDTTTVLHRPLMRTL